RLPNLQARTLALQSRADAVPLSANYLRHFNPLGQQRFSNQDQKCQKQDRPPDSLPIFDLFITRVAIRLAALNVARTAGNPVHEAPKSELCKTPAAGSKTTRRKIRRRAVAQAIETRLPARDE